MRHGSLFTGIGGFDLAAQWMGWENVFQVEWDARCQNLLKQNFKGVDLYGNIDDFDGTRYTGSIDVLSGGPPCQPASNAGKRKGEKDDRWKWPEAIRVFGEVRPRVGVFENPDDLLTLDDGRAFERICVSLEDLGYAVETYGIPAACVEAWHERDRIWIIAYANDLFHPSKVVNRADKQEAGGGKKTNCGKGETSFRERIRFEYGASPKTYRQASGWVLRQPDVVGVVHGLPDEVDRIKALGNAIDPYVSYEIFKAIEMICR